MKLLLDTVTFLDAVLDPKSLPGRVTDLLINPENERYVSTVSSWEIAVKYSLGKLALPDLPERFVPEHRQALAADSLAIDEESALHVVRLPHLHRDPFDRLLICQAIIHGLTLLTPDPRIAKYPVRTIW